MMREFFTWMCFMGPVVTLLCASVVRGDLGFTCAQHPASALIKRSVLIRSWEFLGKDTAMTVDGRVAYYPRYKRLDYTPIDNAGSTKYKNLDFFYIGGARDSQRGSSLAVVYFQRPAVVYMFVNAKGYMPKNPSEGSMPGWKSEGWAYQGSGGKTLSYGLHQKSTFTVTRYVFVFSKRTHGRLHSIVLPHFGWVRRSTSMLMAKGSYHIRVAEVNGIAPALPSAFKGTRIFSNERCPDVLHEAWSTGDDNPQDRDTQMKRFGSWHPQWDPCFWCAFDHEHGSAAPFLMDYQPKYGLTEYKNGRGIESNPGFKDFVFEHGNLMVYLSVHAQTSSLRRVQVSVHTITIAMKDKRTGELLVELTVKGDFGFLAARKSGNAFLPLTREGIRMKKKQMESKPYQRFFRSINVVNSNKLDPRFLYRYPPIAGTYEEWVVSPPCTSASIGGELTFDIQDPITGILSMPGKKPVWLGRTYADEGFRPNLGMKRTVRARNFTVSAEACGFGINFKGGHFYTDVHGKKLLKGPSPRAVRQFIKPGFRGSIYGKWTPSGLWHGLHRSSKEERFFLPHGYGIDHSVN